MKHHDFGQPARAPCRGLARIDVLVASAGVLFIGHIAAADVSGDTVPLQPRSQAHASVAPATIGERARGECEPTWAPAFGQRPGMNDRVRALAVFDDGSGPAVYAGGDFRLAGGVPAHHIAKWNGRTWTAFGSMTQTVRTLTVFDDGNGPALYAGGDFFVADGVPVNHVAKWDGDSWTSLGTGMNAPVRALHVFDDGSGSGPALIAGGDFTTAGGVAVARMARWDGHSWTALGAGMNDAVHALTVFDEGTGAGNPILYAGGLFTKAGGVPANRIAKWDGGSWTPVGTGMDYWVSALTVFDDGSGRGPELFAGGHFSTAGGVPARRIARWDGESWSPLGTGMTGSVWALTTFDDGSGAGLALYAGGGFFQADGVTTRRIARWDGDTWSPVGSGLKNGPVYAMTGLDDGSGLGPELFVGGAFVNAEDARLYRIARWDGKVWESLGNGLDGSVWDFAVFDDGSGGAPALYIAGDLSTVDGIAVNHIARWDGVSWGQVAGGTNTAVRALEVFDDGSGGGPALYVGGLFGAAGGVPVSHIARWDGDSWTPLGTGTNHSVWALAVFDDGSGSGPALHVAGSLTSAGGVPAARIAKWDGRSWTPLGAGLNNFVTALTVFDDGSGDGPALYAGGGFTMAGGAEANRIARWDGNSWTSLGLGMSDTVYTLAVFDEGSGNGPALFAGGPPIKTSGPAPGTYLARWDGDSWTPLGAGVNGSVRALTVFDDGSGSGPALYAGGEFTTAGGLPANRLAKWDGNSWTPLGVGMSDRVDSLTGLDDGPGNGPSLYVGGRFTTSEAGDSHLARWQGCAAAPECDFADLDCDGAVDGADLLLLLIDWGVCEGCVSDINGDGFVNVDDLVALLGAFD